MRRYACMICLTLLVCIEIFAVGCQEKTEVVETNRVVMKTSMGEIEIELYPDKAPVSVENFLAYVRDGFYDNTIFHRVIKGFMIQGGGFDKDHTEKGGKYPPIVNEAKNGLANERGTIAYARTKVINSATSQFFINHVDNPGLDHTDETPAGFGYAVFGKVVRGMGVVDKIAGVSTGVKPLIMRHGGELHEHNAKDVPTKSVVIKTARIVME